MTPNPPDMKQYHLLKKDLMSIFTVIKTEFFSQADESRISATIELQRGTRVDQTIITANNNDSLLKVKYPEIKIIVTSTGSDEGGFELLKIPFIIMLSIPFAFSGEAIALFLSNTTLSIISHIGTVMLIGIVVKNAIVLVDLINLMRERGYELYEAIAISGR